MVSYAELDLLNSSLIATTQKNKEIIIITDILISIHNLGFTKCEFHLLEHRTWKKIQLHIITDHTSTVSTKHKQQVRIGLPSWMPEIIFLSPQFGIIPPPSLGIVAETWKLFI